MRYNCEALKLEKMKWMNRRIDFEMVNLLGQMSYLMLAKRWSYFIYWISSGRKVVANHSNFSQRWCKGQGNNALPATKIATFNGNGHSVKSMIAITFLTNDSAGAALFALRLFKHRTHEKWNEIIQFECKNIIGLAGDYVFFRTFRFREEKNIWHTLDVIRPKCCRIRPKQWTEESTSKWFLRITHKSSKFAEKYHWTHVQHQNDMHVQHAVNLYEYESR